MVEHSYGLEIFLEFFIYTMFTIAIMLYNIFEFWWGLLVNSWYWFVILGGLVYFVDKIGIAGIVYEDDMWRHK